MKKILLLISLCLVSSLHLHAQSAQEIDQATSQYLSLPTVVPSSPTVASIEKFGNIPVDYSTGVPNISIPIYTIKCGDLSWPIAVSYNSSGIKVDEGSSNVGLGWALLGPGVISRSVVGTPDEYRPSSPIWDTVSYQDATYLRSVVSGAEDSQSDVFQFNFNGRSGKFMIKQNGKIMQIPYSPLKIINNSFTSFTIIDEKGVIYTFDQLETQNFTSPVPPGYGANLKSSWYLSKVVLPDTKQEIDFVFTTAGISSSNTFSFTQNFGGTWETGPGITSTIYQAQPVIHQQGITTTSLQLSQINFPNGSVQIGYTNDRQDVVGTATGRVSSIGIYKTSPASQLLKTYKFSQSYFTNNPGGTYTAALSTRLKLDTVKEIAGDMSTQHFYSFEYNTSPMMPRESYGQDQWGFNNGVTTNTSLIQRQLNVPIGGTEYTVGDADRHTDTSLMKACVIKTVHWPAGGKTSFAFEAHQYNVTTGQTTLTTNQVTATASSPSVSATFTYPTDVLVSNPRLIVNITSFPGQPAPTQKPYVKLVDQADLTHYLVLQMGNSSVATALYQALPLLARGHSYTLYAYVFPNTANPTMQAKIGVEWDVAGSTPVTGYGGGLRVKQVRDYDANGTVLTDNFYQYSSASILTPYTYVTHNFDDGVIFRNGYSEVPGNNCTWYPSGNENRIYHSSSIYPLSTVSGSPILYSDVQKFTRNASGTDIGKTETTYDIIQDMHWPYGDQQFHDAMIVSEAWQNGYMASQTEYKNVSGVYHPIKSVVNTYAQLQLDTASSLKVYPNLVQTGCDSHLNYTFRDIVSIDLNFFLYYTYTGSKKLLNAVNTTYDDSENGATDTVFYQYTSPTNDFVTQTTENDSYGAYRISQLKYPADSSTVPVYASMVSHNIVSPVIQQKNFYQAAGSTTVDSTENVHTHYKDWFGNGLVLKPDYVRYASYTNPIEPRVKYTGYDDHGNPLSVQKIGGPLISYIWGFNKQYPTAQVTNSDSLHIAYTGFEDGTTASGHWHFTSAGVTNTATSPALNIRSGTMAYKIASGSVTASMPAGTYIVSYWGTAAVTVNGAAPTISGDLDTRGWQYFEHTLTLASAGTITVSGTGTTLLDELRLYPVGSEMVSFTYDPLVGVTSVENKDGHNIFYEYDYLQRLAYVRDDHRSITKEYKYNYANTTTPPLCPIIVPNLAAYSWTDHLFTLGPPPVPTDGVVIVFNRTETNYVATISFTTTVSSGSPSTYNLTIGKGLTTNSIKIDNHLNNFTGLQSGYTISNSSGDRACP